MRSPQRRPVSRGNQEKSFGLRDRKALRPSLTNEASSPSRQITQSPRRGSAASQAFAAPPRRVSRKIETPTRAGDIGRGGAPTTPTNNPTRGNDPDEQLASELDSATRELENSGLLVPSAFPDDLLEPELPPTPTQLGRQKIPEALQSRLSGSNIGRRSGNDLLEPSTLKPAETTLSGLNEEELDEPDVRKRKSVRRELLAQLNQLKDDVAELEKWAKRGPDKLQPDQEAVASLM
jgi:hypothetical protein